MKLEWDWRYWLVEVVATTAAVAYAWIFLGFRGFDLLPPVVLGLGVGALFGFGEGYWPGAGKSNA